jgi:predicted permease
VMAALFTAMLFTPLVNGPTIGVITARTPVDLRPKMMTALISVSSLAAPAGFLVAGQLLEPWGVEHVFAAVAVGMTGAALAFAVVALRHRDESVADAPVLAA